jgi:hypothetical protein
VALGQGDTTMVMSPEDYAFFDVFRHGPSGGATPKR